MADAPSKGGAAMSKPLAHGPHQPISRAAVKQSRGQHTLQSMSGPEFTGTSAVFEPVRALPPGIQLIAWGALLLVGMGGCTAAWIDQQSYVPSTNICRADQVANAGQLGCVVQSGPSHGGQS